MTGISRAVEAAGGVQALADKLGVAHQNVYQWRIRGWVPGSRAVQIEALYAIPRAELLKPEIAALITPNDALNLI
jgi:DNA-binding transcriptional regulator YdaS (Cro superfamily)